jgi:hypothetical protein
MLTPPPGTHKEGAAPSVEQTSLDRGLGQAVREVRLLLAVTPRNLTEERERLRRELADGRAPVPRYEYVPAKRTELRRLLESLAARVHNAVPKSLANTYEARIAELDLEARIAEASGSARLGMLSSARFDEEDPVFAGESLSLSRKWIGLRPSEPDEPARTIPSDSSDPDSLASAMRAAIGAARVPFVVEISETLASRAATGERTIWIAQGRPLTLAETRRTVVHEIEGHVLPRVRASKRAPIFALGTARGSDDQEGLALVAEDRAGWLDERRQRELAARHLSTLRMTAGATFADVATALVKEYGFSRDDALGIAERAFRGSDGKTPGLGRERVYLGAWLRVRAHLARRPEDLELLGSGQVAVKEIEALRGAA